MRCAGYRGFPSPAMQRARACLRNGAKPIADTARSDRERQPDHLDDPEATPVVALVTSQQGDSMDDCRFDNLTRVIAEQADRRTAVKRFTGGLAALAALARVELGFAQGGDVGIEVNCTPPGHGCKKSNQCCSLNCKKKKKHHGGKKKGKCKCVGAGHSCKADIGCCKGVCHGGHC